ncbi:MAG: DUF3881 family protein [Lachnospiraceae bacterium]|nr:DUF3881 family protein [Lachnospiraceae bacterium]
MHQFLSAVGFSKIKTKKELMDLIKKVIKEPSSQKFIETDKNSVICEYTKYFTPTTGITVRGEYDENNELTLDFYYPVCRAYEISTNENIGIERYAANEYFAGICDDPRIGVTLIFDIPNSVDVMRRFAEDSGEMEEKASVSFSGMSVNGMVMFPIKKDSVEKAKTVQNTNNRNKLLMAARNGDENAIESLTLDDIDTYAQLSKKIRSEDVYSLVDSYFMPYGVECNLYSVMAEISDICIEKNGITDETVYILCLDYNGMDLNISINEKDLLGEPMIGRRFKGTVLIQGKVNFS